MARTRSGIQATDGLGISLPRPTPPKTPTRTVASATLDALLGTVTPATPTTTTSPVHRTKTPLGSHKKLPKPPPPSSSSFSTSSSSTSSSSTSSSSSAYLSSTSSPMSVLPTPIKHSRSTLRSLSESVLPSCRGRPSPETRTPGGLDIHGQRLSVAPKSEPLHTGPMI